MKYSIEERSLDFGVSVFRMCRNIQKTKNEFIITKQLIRSSSSIGANSFEARYAESKPDFIHKLSISVKESHESIYWLKFLLKTGLIDKGTFENMQDEANQIRKILTTVILKTKENQLKNVSKIDR